MNGRLVGYNSKSDYPEYCDRRAYKLQVGERVVCESLQRGEALCGDPELYIPLGSKL